MLESGLQPRTPPAGQCVQFAYHREGLSAGELRALLHPVSDAELLGYPVDHSGDTVLAHSSADVAGSWSSAEMIYTYPGRHTIVFEAIPCRSRRVGSCSPDYRGHIAVDSVRLAPDGCLGHCTFDGGACGWTQDDSDDFQWELSRGSLSRDTGPRADHGSELFGSTSGGYMFASSAFPRRPGDRARLLSPQLSAGQPRCFRFWLYLFGPGVGTLRVLLLAGDRRQELWRLSGPAGQQWHQGLVTVSAEAGTFRLALEAELGTERLGDIAVDDVSLESGICPAAPQTAAPWSSGCTFEVDTCGWAGVEGDRGLWERVVAAAADGIPATDHTTGRPGGGLVRLGPADPPPPGHMARLLSPRLDRPDAATAACLTFRWVR
ncbi:MAM and LDL-receptor class A domain-containing protein 1-like [Amphibalanus amphitrite]|uniref:MAM and LDL-receptor class A domain-containing protein 1-like n=1 Tax=Amphibalanus amphitrite TaxID=1232801 RepID=UPI001C90EBF0|nr:MAM and LDL-receptor class A domain-containing protein 1-like [Amphibalanus amphitrite]